MRKKGLHFESISAGYVPERKKKKIHLAER